MLQNNKKNLNSIRLWISGSIRRMCIGKNDKGGWDQKYLKSSMTYLIIFNKNFNFLRSFHPLIILLAYYCSNVNFHFFYKLFIWNFPYLSSLCSLKIPWMLSDMDILHISVMMNFSFVFLDGRKLKIEKFSWEAKENLNYMYMLKRWRRWRIMNDEEMKYILKKYSRWVWMMR